MAVSFIQPVPRVSRRGKFIALGLIFALFAIAARVVTAISREYLEASEKALATFEHLVAAMIILIFIYSYRNITIFILDLLLGNKLLAALLFVHFSVIYGALGGLGLPYLFWHEWPWSQFMAGVGSSLLALFVVYIIYIFEFDRDVCRSESARIAARLRPFLDGLGVAQPAEEGDHLLDSEERHQLQFFLAVVGLPPLVVLAIPAVLPSFRPMSDVVGVSWAWLLGLGAGTCVVGVVAGLRLFTRLHRAVHRSWRRVRREGDVLRGAEEVESSSHADTRNLLLVFALIYLVSFVDHDQAQWLYTPAFLLCMVLALMAAGHAFLASRNRIYQLIFLGVAAAGLAMHGFEEYKTCFPGLEEYYPQGVFSTSGRRPAYGPTSLETLPTTPSVGLSEVEVLERWRDSCRETDGSRRGPPKLVVITTSGGAIRAALWTAVVLTDIERELPDFPRHIRLVTGASGGMLGASHYVTTLVEPRRRGGFRLVRRTIKPGRHRRSSREDADSLDRVVDAFSDDYLSPIAWQLALRDMPAFFLPWRQSNDRGRVLEQAWVRGTANGVLNRGLGHGLNGLTYTFDQLKPLEGRGWLPSLVFSPMIVEDGRRLLISNLDLRAFTENPGEGIIKEVETDEFPDLYSRSAVEFFSLFPRAHGFQISTAARMSATFPLATPAATLPTSPRRRVVDAGYYDNYGVNFAADWIYRHHDWLMKNTSGVLLIEIRAFKNERRLKFLDEGIWNHDKGLNKLAMERRDTRFERLARVFSRGTEFVSTPLRGLAEARGSAMHFRNDEQQVVLSDVFRSKGPHFFRSVVFSCDAALSGVEEQQVETLNWYLTNREKKQIKDNMHTRQRNAQRLQALVAWWKSGR